MNKFNIHSRATVWFGALLLAVLTAGCDGGGGGDPILGTGGTGRADVTPPTVTFTAPANLDVSVAPNRKVSATFSEAMDPASITGATFTVSGPGGSAVAGVVTYSGVTAVFAPSSNLAANTLYTATITTGAKDVAGNALGANFVWTFTTAAVLDTINPSVSITDPSMGATNVAQNKKITVGFSEAMDPATINGATFVLAGPGGAAVPGTVSYVGVTATFSPTSDLAANTIYNATVTNGAKDLVGNPLNSAYSWSFTTAPTGAAIDTTPPTVSSTDPANNASSVALNKKISATFSETMDPATITNITFTVKLNSGGAAIAGTVSYIGLVATFSPTANLLAGTSYLATITTGAKDLAGNALASTYTWVFTTGIAADTTAPTVISTDPANAGQNVVLNKKIAATFSEAMDPLSISTATFTLKQGATAIAGTVTYVGVIATFSPNANLAAGTTYTATITTGTRDLAGNLLAADYVWTFSTGAAPDVTPPTVSNLTPLDLAVGVCTSQSVNATFSEAMDPATITAANFKLANGAIAIAGAVSYDPASMVATLTPTSVLAASTLFTATITTGVRDLAGNALVSNKVWSFTTGAPGCGAIPPPPIVLGAAAPFGTFGGGSGMTNQGIFTVINGDIGTTGASTTVTGFHDAGVGCIYTETPLNIGKVNGKIYTAAPPPTVGCPSEGTAVTAAIAAQGALAALAAWNSLSPAAMPGGIDPGAGQLGGLTLAPGIYKSASGAFLITGSDLTLDGKGDANATWVFQTASSLTVGAPGAPRSIILIGGAQAKNVFWQVGSAATINAAGGGTMVGTIIASAGITFSTAGNVTLVTLNGRALSLNASTTLVNTVINVPAP